MHVDNAGPRTWLLATLAGWALLAWALALAGMGGRIGTLQDDASLAQRLPQPRPSAPERIGPLGQYAEIGVRPLFAEDRRPQPFSLQPEGQGEAPAPAFDFVLTSVLLTPTLKMAIVQPSAGGESVRMKLGEAPDEAQGWRLVALNPRSAIFEGPDGQKTLDLRTFDGAGGPAPTAVARPEPGAPLAEVEERPGRQGPVEVDPGSATVPTPAPAPAPAPVAPPTATKPPRPTAAVPANAPVTTPEAQMEAIRKRIEARRAQLRAEAQKNQQPPANTP